MKQVLRVFIDGASRGNPGPASCAAVFMDDKNQVVDELSQVLGITTNNTAEYSALVMALQYALAKGYLSLDFFSDSELLVRQCNGQYKVKEDTIKLFHVYIRHMKTFLKHFSISHVPREQNTLADKKANHALDNNPFLL